jgi:polyisoprenyl-teichoic acid--peptidoglycan teichoic acid transferase
MAQPNNRRPHATRRNDRLAKGLVVAFVLLASVIAVLAFVFVKNTVARWTMTGLDGIAITESGGSKNPPSENVPVPTGPLQTTEGMAAKPWDGVSRINILFLGLDARDWDSEDTRVGDPARSDTMILFTIDPLSKTAGMLSIPRDLWVNVPNYGYNKINQAYFIGDARKLPGGGPGLAAKTVEQFLGVPIDYYAQIDFFAFVDFIDTLGGIEVDVPEEITVDPIGPHNTVVLQAGKQNLKGDVSLAYARNREVGDDFGRSGRQMQVIMAIRNKIISLNMLPTLVTKAPVLYRELSNGIHTNLDLQQIIQLALLAQSIPQENIKQHVIGPSEISFGSSPDGLSILIPVPDKIRLLRDQVFTTGGPVSPAAVSSDPAELMKAEAAKVLVKNGTSSAGLGGRTTDYLSSLGISVLEPGNADEMLPSTTIYDYSGKPYTVKFLVDQLKINKNRIFNRFDPNAQVDIIVILGADWARDNSLP